MKTPITFLIIFFYSFLSFGQTYYWSGGKKIQITEDLDRKYFHATSVRFPNMPKEMLTQ